MGNFDVGLPQEPEVTIVGIEVSGISKSFAGNTVLDDLTLELKPGEVHSIVGENGAGKSTLMKIIAGVYTSDKGNLFMDGRPIHINSPHSAVLEGISMVHQELNLVKNLTVLENIFLAQEPRGWFGAIDWRTAEARVEALSQQLGLKVDVSRRAGSLTFAEAKMVEILKACISDLRVLILDEPTAALAGDDVATLFSLVRRLRAEGKTVVYVSHRLAETFELCDRVSVLKDGKLVGTWDTKDIDQNTLTNKMVGREINDIYPPRPSSIPRSESPTLHVEELTDGKSYFDINLDVAPGEILGIGGMTGHGQRELIRSMFGLHSPTGGSIRLCGESVKFKNTNSAIVRGVAFLSDDRRGEGLAITQSVVRNVGYPSMKKRSWGGILSARKEANHAVKTLKSLNVKLASIYQPARVLSGGNQQRLVLAKWLPTNPRLLLVHEPTLGVDVGAKKEIYEILRGLTAQGLSILMVTSDMHELLYLSDRIIVLYEGRIQGEFAGGESTEEDVVRASLGNYEEIAL